MQMKWKLKWIKKKSLNVKQKKLWFCVKRTDFSWMFNMNLHVACNVFFFLFLEIEQKSRKNFNEQKKRVKKSSKTHLSTDLVTALSSLNMNDFSHFEWGCFFLNRTLGKIKNYCFKCKYCKNCVYFFLFLDLNNSTYLFKCRTQIEDCDEFSTFNCFWGSDNAQCATLIGRCVCVPVCVFETVDVTFSSVAGVAVCVHGENWKEARNSGRHRHELLTHVHTHARRTHIERVWNRHCVRVFGIRCSSPHTRRESCDDANRIH